MTLSGFSGLQGLNKFHPKRFEDLINRRGWIPVLWERAVKCPCHSDDTGNPDPKDPTCGGVGYIYQEDLAVEVAKEQLCVVSAGQATYTLLASLTGSPDATRSVSRVIRVWNETQAIDYTVSGILGRDITIAGAPLPVPGDKVFANYEFLRDAGASVKAIVTSVDYQKDYIPSGEWLQGDSIMTVSGQYKMGFRDRITIPEEVVRASEFKRRYETDVLSRSLERLRYKSGIIILLVRDLTQTFVLGTDFTLGPDQTIVWGAGLRPKHKVFHLKYTGNATSATMAVTATEITVTLVGQTDGSLDLVVPFATYSTATQAADYINTRQGYVVGFERQSDTPGIDHEERMVYCVPQAGVDVKGIDVTIENEDKTQYTVEYMHQLAYSIYMKQGMVRRHDDGSVLPGKYWLRLWEHTDLFSNDGS